MAGCGVLAQYVAGAFTAAYGGPELSKRLAWPAPTVQDHEPLLDMADHYVQYAPRITYLRRQIDLSTCSDAGLAHLNSPFDLQ